MEQVLHLVSWNIALREAAAENASGYRLRRGFASRSATSGRFLGGEALLPLRKRDRALRSSGACRVPKHAAGTSPSVKRIRG